MSGDTSIPVNAHTNGTEDIVVVAPHKGLSKKFTVHKRGLVSVCILAAVAGLLAIGWYVWHTHNGSPASVVSTATSSSTKIKALDPLSQVTVDAVTAANKSGASTGDAVYEKAIADAKTDSAKYTLYMAKGALDLNAKEYDAAIAAGQAAQKIKADYQAWGFLGRVYDAEGDTKNAIMYYQKAATDNVEFNYEQQFFQQRYEELTNGS